MDFQIFTLHPNLFSSFFSESLIARAVSKKIIDFKLINWRDYVLADYKSVDDRPFGGGHGMVLEPEAIYNALVSTDSVSKLCDFPSQVVEHSQIYPNNDIFEQAIMSGKIAKSQATILLTPRGYPLNQNIAQWLSTFDKLNILCGRYEGFDARVSNMVDMEISLGPFVLNGGEVASMALMESVARLLPDFITKKGTVLHDSFSQDLNQYQEQQEYIVGKRNLGLNTKNTNQAQTEKLFFREIWARDILPYIEHPQYTRPAIWKNFAVPEVLLKGNHRDIDTWRQSQWRDLLDLTNELR